MKPFNSTEARQHLDTVARHMRVTLHHMNIDEIEAMLRLIGLDVDPASFANPRTRSVYLLNSTAVIDEATYAAALHEIGHIADEDDYRQIHQIGRPNTHYLHLLKAHNLAIAADSMQALMMERSAWSWAKAHARFWTPMMAAVEEYGIRSYEMGMLNLPKTIDREAAVQAIVHGPSDLRKLALERLEASNAEP